MKAFLILLALPLLSISNASAATLLCRGTHGNQGTGKLEIAGQQLRFSGNFNDTLLKINSDVECSGGLNSSESPSRYNPAGSCSAYTTALLYKSGVLMFVDDSKVEEPKISATYFCK